MANTRIHFQNNTGLRLSGHLEMPADKKPVAYALFAHCFTCGKDLKSAGEISRELARSGFGVLRFDFIGLGNSEGDFAQAISVTAERFAAIMSASP